MTYTSLTASATVAAEQRWRRLEGIDHILDTPDPNEAVFSFFMYVLPVMHFAVHVLNTARPLTHHKFSKAGQPIGIYTTDNTRVSQA